MTFFKHRSNGSKSGTMSAVVVAPLLLASRKRNSRNMTMLTKPKKTPTTPTTKRREVQFAPQPPVIHTIPDHVRPDEQDQVWYQMDYLQQARRDEIKNNLRAQYYGKRCDIPVDFDTSDKLTWRGMEDILEQSSSRQDKVHAHVQAVLTKFRSQPKRGLGKSNAAALRTYARALSKADRQRAVALAEKDELIAADKPLPAQTQPSKQSSSRLSLRSWSSPRDFKPQNLLKGKLTINSGGLSWRMGGTSMDSTRTIASDQDHSNNTAAHEQ